ncbi:hypothetical protein [Asticcacaulis sp. AC466]|uniref:hypothetical protein n=1 Tax=Asticcacaulis sp. AC466 TaxID=1282362 RepID=UPI0004202897|nr:hypothetical protein [Asticcacaulis sp. AC466]
MADEKVTVAKFIGQVREVDRIKISIDLAGAAHVTSYRYQRACNEDKTVEWWLENHIAPHIARDADVTVYDRNDRPVGGYVALKHLRRD